MPRTAARVRERDPIVDKPIVELRRIIIGENVQMRPVDDVERRRAAADAVAVDLCRRRRYSAGASAAARSRPR